MLRSASGLRIRYRFLLRCLLRCLRLRTTHNKMGGDGEESGGGGASSPPHPSSPAAAGVGGWQAFQDDEGRTYYYHAEREETQWEAPEGFVPAAPGAGGELGGRDPGAVPGGAADAAADAATGARAAPAQEQAQAPATAQDERRWVGYRDDEGRTYYFNEATGETQWERPEGRGVTVIEEEEEEGGAAADSATATATAAAAAPGGGGAEAAEGEERDAGAGDGQGDGRGGGQGAAAPVEAKGGAGAPAERDPREVALEEAEEALNQPDAVLEFDCLDNIREVIDQRGSSVGGPRAMQSLVSSHQGLTAVSGLLGLWLAELRSTLTAASGTRAGPATAAARGGGGGGRPRPGPASGSPGPFGEAADHVRSVAGGVVSRFAMEHFTKTSGDNILNLSKAEATFLEEMIGSSTWRRLLIDLSARHTDSALLTYCLKAISKGGHHREIAKRIDQSDYFGVFNSMLTSEVEQIGMISASTVASSASTDGGMAAILTDLRRTCTSTSYTYVYTREVLRELVTRAGAEARTEPDPAARAALMRAVRRWERLREELEAEMVAPGAAAAGSSMLERKRKLDVALMTSDLHQRQRRRTDPTGAGEAGPGLAKVADMRDMARDALDMAAAKMIKRYASGLSLDSDTTEQLLRASYGDSKLLVGDVLNAHPTALEALMTYLYKPGRMRVKSIEIRHRCAKLVALSALALQEALANQGTGEKGEAAATTTANGDGDEGGGGSGDGDSDGPSSVNLDESTKAVLRGSQLCEQIENVVSFTAVDDATHGKDSSAGRELSSLCIRHAPVGRGALVWATERARSADFCDSAAYPTLAPSILSLARIVGLHHPLLRPMAIDLALTFIGHSPPDLAFQKVQALKEQSLRLLLLLATRGEAARVLGAVGTSGLLDAPNLRYFVAGLLQVVQPPVSLALVHSLGGLLSSKACVEALRSLEHFAAESRAALMGLLDAFRLALSSKGNLASSATPANKALVSNLILLYR